MKTRSQLALEALDEVARGMELKWGVGRLTRVVALDLADRFHRQLEKLNAAITDEATGGSIANTEHEATRMTNAWKALDAAAEAAGALPLSPRTLEGHLPDGRLLVVCDRPESAHRVAGDNRAAVVWSMDEICRVLWQFEMVNQAKTVWPGAKVEAVRIDPETTKPPVNWQEGDPLPFEMLAAG